MVKGLDDALRQTEGLNKGIGKYLRIQTMKIYIKTPINLLILVGKKLMKG